MAKKTNIYEKQEQRFWDDYSRAQLIRDLYPSLDSLFVEMTFNNPDWGGDPSPKTELRKRDSKAFFKVQCPHYECVHGGFDLSNAVAQLVKNADKYSVGEITCQGWQDQERINKHRCLLRMKYKIVATYDGDAG
ncbi:hypothetical protein NYO91_16180 [Arhodomonas aquaeolei]|uniref:hypothetical protein n=1 Tax=Arhodomonas aquaeolei TaxID=2369 RepID=UPI002169E100|nr:hypothetical protein [Arhodomonas aquaeolei]MCS4505625.1 hypothetical protein [Arhodomonas aquaeolei]